jgi:hypothetical protein
VNAFTLIHVVISLVGILSGFVVLFGMLNARRLDCWTKMFIRVLRDAAWSRQERAVA